MYFQWFSNYSFTQPSFTPEFEGGWFSSWGAPVFYDQASTYPQELARCPSLALLRLIVSIVCRRA